MKYLDEEIKPCTNGEHPGGYYLVVKTWADNDTFDAVWSVIAEDRGHMEGDEWWDGFESVEVPDSGPGTYTHYPTLAEAKAEVDRSLTDEIAAWRQLGEECDEHPEGGCWGPPQIRAEIRRSR